MRKSIQIICSKRKTISIEIKHDLRIIVRAPEKMKKSDIEKFISAKIPWIETHIKSVEAKLEPIQPYKDSEIELLAERAKAVIPKKVEAFARLLSVPYVRITIRHQVSRWGSCSSRSNLNFNCLLMLCPDEVINYVIIHELCHIKHMNHSKEFWSLVELYCPNYRIQRKWLKDEGAKLTRRLRANG